MRVYLLNPPFKPNFVRCGRWQGAVARGGTLYYPIWLAYATGILGQQYKDVRLIDAVARGWNREAVIKDVKTFNPDIIIIESNFASLENDIDVARMLKEQTKNAKMVLVGPPASQFTDKILDNDGVDIVVRFGFDFTVKEIAYVIAEGGNLKAVNSISYKENGQIIHNPNREFVRSDDLDMIPFVSEVYKTHLHVKDYFLGHTLYPMVQILTGRGCPHQCTFCSWPETLTGRKLRTRSIKNVVDEFEYIIRELPEVKEIFLEDDTFTIGKRRIREFCEEIKRRGLRITWSCNARANLEYETMKIMKEAGCRLLDVGYESGSDEILNNIKKGISTDRMHQFAKDARRVGFVILGDFVFGFPGETKETAEKTIAFAKELSPDIVQFAVSVPIPGTKFYEWAQYNRFLLTDELEKSVDEEGFQKCIVSYPEFTDRDVEEYVDKALKKYYLSPSYVPIALRRIFRKNGLRELVLMIKSARIFFKYLRRRKR